MSRREQVNRFMEHYTPCLLEAVTRHPDEYAFGPSSVDAVALKMRSAFMHGSYSNDGRAVRAACRRLGIKSTYTAIEAFLGPIENAGVETACVGQ